MEQMNSHGRCDGAVAKIIKEKKRLMIDIHDAQAKNPSVTTAPLLCIVLRTNDYTGRI
jgi:hypothetical protein